MAKLRLYTLRVVTLDWTAMHWTVELRYGQEDFRVSGVLVPRTAKPRGYIAIRADDLFRYRRDWTRWAPLTLDRHRDIVDTAIAEVRQRITDREREAA